MELYNYNLDNEPDVQVTFSTEESFFVLMCKASGIIKTGSAGNNALDYLFGKLCQYYFQGDICHVLLLDFSDLEYEYGNRLGKSLTFFREIGRDEFEKDLPVIVVVSGKCDKGIRSLIDFIKPQNITLETNVESAIMKAEEMYRKFLEEL